MEGFLRVDHATNLPGSPTNSFLADEVASICPLITPSPPTNDLINPLPESTEPNFVIGQELANKLQHVKDDDKADSASSSSSALAEPACAQLLSHRNVYHHMIKDEDTEIQETNGKTQALQLTFRNPPDNYFFMSWNWPLIRKIFLWIFLSGLVAMLALVITMISTLPRTCNPPTFWYQGNVLYEIFPASFYNADNNMEGNFKGIAMKADYIRKLGVKGIRLNPIFSTPHYPHDFDNASNLTDIAPSLGSLTNFKSLVKHLDSRDISLILDLPLYHLIKEYNYKKARDQLNETISGHAPGVFKSKYEELDIIEGALIYWMMHGVRGFYLKGLEYFVEIPNFPSSLRRWKSMLGEDRILIVSENVINRTPNSILNIVLNNIDLVDIKLEVENGATAIIKQISSIQNGTLFSKPGMPWIHWSLGNANSKRLANILPHGNATLGATLFQLMLPGTPSIFYGDEIGVHAVIDTAEDIEHLDQLTMMPWANETRKTLSWLHGEEVPARYDQLGLISKMVNLRSESPSIYMNSVYKEGVNKANAEIKYAEKEFLVVQRWYPRRKAYVVACNLGSIQLSADLSTLLYTGKIVVGPRTDSRSETISFKDISLWPGESVVIVLD